MSDSILSIGIFVEDPGAINFILDLPEYLQKKNVDSIIIATGPAIEFLRNRNISFEEAGELNDVTNTIQTAKIDSLLIGTSQNLDSIGLSLISYCKSNKIKTFGFVDMEIDADRRFSGRTDNPLKYAPDFLIVPDKSTYDYFTLAGFNSDDILVSGNPNYQRTLRVRNKYEKLSADKDFREIHKIESNRKIVIIIAEHLNNNDPRMLANNQYLFNGKKDSVTRTEIVLDEILDAFSYCKFKPYIILRLHPKNSPEEFNKYAEKIDFFSYSEEPFALIMNSDYVFGMTSMLMMEAYLLGKKTIAVLPTYEEKNWAPHTKNDYVPIAFNKQELISLTSALIEGKTIPAANHYEQKMDSNEAIYNFLIEG